MDQTGGALAGHRSNRAAERLGRNSLVSAGSALRVLLAVVPAVVLSTVGSAASAGEPYTWPGGHPPIVPSWAPAEMIAKLDRDRDGLLDAFENTVAQAFVPKFRLAAAFGNPDPAVRDAEGPAWNPLYPEPVVLQQVTPIGLEGTAVRMRMRYIHLYGDDAGCGEDGL